MSTRNSALGMLYIILGFLLFILAIGTWMIRLALAALGIYIINYGLMLRGKPSLKYIFIYSLDRFR